MLLKKNWRILFFTLCISLGNCVAAGDTNFALTDEVADVDTKENGTFVSFCNVTVPSSVRGDVWPRFSTPPEDDLDRYLADKTGCTYQSIGYFRIHYTPKTSFDGTFEWRGALRAPRDVMISVWWGSTRSSTGYYFLIGREENTITKVATTMSNKEWILSTPNILSADRYVAIYIRIRAGSLTFGRECDREPLFTHNVTVARGAQVSLRLSSITPHTKYLLDCPTSPAGNTTEMLLQNSK